MRLTSYKKYRKAWKQEDFLLEEEKMKRHIVIITAMVGIGLAIILFSIYWHPAHQSPADKINDSPSENLKAEFSKVNSPTKSKTKVTLLSEEGQISDDGFEDRFVKPETSVDNKPNEDESISQKQPEIKTESEKERRWRIRNSPKYIQILAQRKELRREIRALFNEEMNWVRLEMEIKEQAGKERFEGLEEYIIEHGTTPPDYLPKEEFKRKLNERLKPIREEIEKLEQQWKPKQKIYHELNLELKRMLEEN